MDIGVQIPVSAIFTMEEDEDFEEFEESKLKKIFVPVGSIFLLLLFLGYFFAIPIQDQITSLFSTEEVENNQVDFSFNNTLIFSNNSLDELEEIYLSNQAVEFKACLKGLKVEETYIINDLYIPKTFSQKFNQVVAEPCSSESLVSLHSHPFRRCTPSQTDINNFKGFKEKSPDALMIIMCETNRFSIHK
tara:strand:+ start:234 stop:803 length:570 start_codon:yes stop_codon:yes gene_type:complete